MVRSDRWSPDRRKVCPLLPNLDSLPYWMPLPLTIGQYLALLGLIRLSTMPNNSLSGSVHMIIHVLSHFGLCIQHLTGEVAAITPLLLIFNQNNKGN
jgi:hypothetical protein